MRYTKSSAMVLGRPQGVKGRKTAHACGAAGSMARTFFFFIWCHSFTPRTDRCQLQPAPATHSATLDPIITR